MGIVIDMRTDSKISMRLSWRMGLGTAMMLYYLGINISQVMIALLGLSVTTFHKRR